MSRFDVHTGMGARAAHADDELTVVSDVALSVFLDEVRLLSAATAPAPTGDLAVLLEQGFEPAPAAPRPVPRERVPLRRWMSRAGVLGAPLAMKIATAATAAAATFGGAAALGVLPDGLQRWASDVAAAVNITIPGGREPATDALAPLSAGPPPEAPDEATVDRAGGMPGGGEDAPGGRGGRGGIEEDPVDAAREADEERRDRAEDRADDRRDAREDDRDEAQNATRDEQRAREDTADDQRDAEEDAADDAEDARDDARDRAKDRADDEADAREDEADDAEDDAEEAVDDAEEAVDDAEDAAEDETDRAEDAGDDAEDAAEDEADAAKDEADDSADAAEDAADAAEDAKDAKDDD